MYFIKTLFSPRSRESQQSIVTNIFYQLNIHGNCRLHRSYHQKLKPYISSMESRSKCMKMLVSKLQQLQNIQSIIKLFTVAHNAIIELNYDDAAIQCLQNLDAVSNRTFNFHDKEQEGWFRPFYRAYIFYLAKIPSISQIFSRIQERNYQLKPQQLIIYYFRIVNQLNILLLPLISIINVIGRYYLKKMTVFEDLYDVLKKQLMGVYDFLKAILKGIFEQFRRIDLIQLQAFVGSVSEFEVMVDKFQDIITCKYFRGVLNKYTQLYIKQENMAQINYYIAQSKSKKQSAIKNT